MEIPSTRPPKWIGPEGQWPLTDSQIERALLSFVNGGKSEMVLRELLQKYRPMFWFLDAADLQADTPQFQHSRTDRQFVEFHMGNLSSRQLLNTKLLLLKTVWTGSYPGAVEQRGYRTDRRDALSQLLGLKDEGKVSPDWERQRLQFSSTDLFERACYLLLEKSDCVKVCKNPRCKKARYFIAKEPRNKYCSKSCATIGVKLSKHDHYETKTLPRREAERAKKTKKGKNA